MQQQDWALVEYIGEINAGIVFESRVVQNELNEAAEEC